MCSTGEKSMKKLAPMAASTLSALTLLVCHSTLVLAGDARDPGVRDPGVRDLGVRDPGVRPGVAGAGAPLAGLSSNELVYFAAATAEFTQHEGIGDGLGPRFNLDGCSGCHAQPAVGGSSPAVNPQVAIATASGARNIVPSFITVNGPIREARFKFHPDGTPDGGVHSIFVISGRSDFNGDASTCNIEQDDFAANLASNNVSTRIPTPIFGVGLMEAIPATTLTANLAANAALKKGLGITGRFNASGNTGTITRFGWKAQNASVLMFSGEAYNVEMGISNELFPTERAETVGCVIPTTPNSYTNMDASTGATAMSSMQASAIFMRQIGPPAPSTTTPGGAASIANGKLVFTSTGCALCHTPSMRTSSITTVAAMANQSVNLFSDLALHQMGPRLADDIQQGGAPALGDEFRTAPLWGVGQRIFFMHDGRTHDLVRAIQLHASPGDSKYGPSEANRVVERFNDLNPNDAQDLLNFLRSL
jgi:CxxC motif-containing protein (DUF1111 family)